MSGRSVWVRWSSVDDTSVTGYVVRAVRGDAVVATVEVPADETRARFRRLPAGTYTFTVAAVNDAGEGAPASSAPLTVDG